MSAKLRCLGCDTVIQSMHRHDFRTCTCGSLSVDGGDDYLRILYQEDVPYEVLTETE